MTAQLIEALQGMLDRFGGGFRGREDQPKTYGCHHTAETCTFCEGLVTGWKAVRAAEAALQSSPAPQAGGWLPIETAPKDGQEFLACYSRQGGVMKLVRWNLLHGFWESKGEFIAGFETNATHWQPLPPAPQATKGGEA